MFFGIISGSYVIDRDGPAAVTGDGMTSPRGNLSSELVWHALLYAFRLRVLRDGWDADADDDNGAANPSSDANAGSGVHRDNQQGVVISDEQAANASAAAAAAAALAARRSRRKDSSTALWHCVRLLLAASPFSEEFAVGPAGQISSAASATAAKTKAAAAAQQGRNRYGLLPSSAAAAVVASPALSTSVLLAPKETFTFPEMVARVVLERVLVLARAYPPDAGNHGIVEKLWEGVQCVSRASCAAAPSAVGVPGVRVGGATAVDGGNLTASCAHSPQAEVTAEERAYERLQSVRRLGRWSASLQENAKSSSPSSNGETTRLSYVHLR